ncbi:MAG: ribonuclease Y [Proteobacteria bacterium]|nr:ribonuclease Y [Pseudomonadota bacterium]
MQYNYVIFIGVFIGFVVLGVIIHRKKLAQALTKAKNDSQKIISEAHIEADRLIKVSLKKAKDEAKKNRRQFEAEAKKKREDYLKLEQEARTREQSLHQKSDQLSERERDLENKEKSLLNRQKSYDRRSAQLEKMIEEHQSILEKISQMSTEEAKSALITTIEAQAKQEAQKKIEEIEAATRASAKAKAQHIIALAIQRQAGEFVSDATVSVVSLPSEDMKGRIIGREGRNIQAIEQATGVDIIIDDTPEAVILSCFNPIRREIAKITLERLMDDGRIHPARIEETAIKVTKEFDQTLKDHGEQAALDVGITDLHPDLLTYLGHLKFKVFHKHSVLQHCVETARIAGMIAVEIGIPHKYAKRAGLLHDIGKAVDQEDEGHHTHLGAKLCSRYGEHSDIVHAIENHLNEDLNQARVLTVCLSAANILSESRMGIRQDGLNSHIKRLEDMEELVRSFEGVQRVLAFQAGREVRVMVDPDAVADEDMNALSFSIASKIRSELAFPGRVKVSLLRESKYVDFAT